MVSHPIKNLLKGLIDYAGLFPPARLDMATAVAAYARHRRSEYSWILGRFVVPAGRLGELEALIDDAWDGTAPWQLSVLVGAEEKDAVAIAGLEARRSGLLSAPAVEAKVETPDLVERLKTLFPGREISCEIPLGDLRPWLEALALAGVRAKIRTGGIVATAFPALREIVQFLIGAATLRIPFKATAGLHHALRGDFPLTYEDRSPCATMHGFLNFFLTAAFARQGQAGEAELLEMLAERHSGAFDFQTAGVSWSTKSRPRGAFSRFPTAPAPLTSRSPSFANCTFFPDLDPNVFRDQRDSRFPTAQLRRLGQPGSGRFPDSEFALRCLLDLRRRKSAGRRGDR
jgi:hypothetical protein